MPPRLDPAVAAVRRAVRAELADIAAGRLVLVACSGGADSLALSAATAFEGRAAGLRVGAVVVNHRLQAASEQVSLRTGALLEAMRLDPVRLVVAEVETRSRSGPEAAARRARYAALEQTAQRLDAETVLLGHTRDDQAETVLLGLARGSGARSLAGMPRRAGRYRRPLLDLDRALTRAACAAEQLPVWEDPHNLDPRFSRIRVRRQVLPALEAGLGPGITAALARTARLLAADADALEAWAEQEAARCAVAGGLAIAALSALPVAVRSRVLRTAALGAGCPASDLTAEHVVAIDRLLTDWHGQQGIDLPGSLRAVRRGGDLRFESAAVAG